MSDPTSPALARYAFAAVGAVVLLNLLLRAFVRLGGVLATFCIAALVAAGLALCFRLRTKRPPRPGERWRIVLLYGALLGVLYLILLGMMFMQEAPGPMGTLLFLLHYLCYPLLAYLFLAERFFSQAGR
ncbi:hypothetical protein [Pseudomonas sp. RIT-PI-AD]|uniref:hypothetical protein n=1 Tax=Pseudomonas sp. RIT-PI-AD TaxID=3035294 RepID=UPI0021D9889E|nr:hypothetical protein [Pseudomonas sp. RIT-PI-AD]